MIRFISLFFCLISVCFGQNLEQNDVFNNCILSYKAVNLSDESTIAAYQPHLNVTPASTQKLITTSKALEVFGPDYNMKSYIGYTGTIQNGELIGDLIIAPNGNPAFCNERFGFSLNHLQLQIEKFLEVNGIQSIIGQVAVIDSVRSKETLPRKWLWEDIGNYFGANPTSTIINENKLELFFTSGAVGSKTEIQRISPKASVRINNNVTAHSGTRDLAYAFSRPLDTEITVYGSIPENQKSFKVIAALPDPSMFLLDWLIDEGIKLNGVTGVILNNTPNQLLKKTVIHEVSLAQIVKETNLHSINIFAENLYQRLLNKGIEFSNNFHLEDGSGLSRFNMIQVNEMIELLKVNQKDDAFLSSLSVAGESGTLKYYFNTPTLRNNLMGKSGYMQGVRSYAGYLTNQKGEKIAFTVVANNVTEKDADIKYLIKKWLEELARS